MSINIQVRGTITAIEQPSSLSCWATVGTMMKCWRDKRSMTIRTAMAEVGQPYLNYFTNNRVLPWSEHDEFGTAMGLTIAGPQCYSVHALVSLISLANSPMFTVIAPGLQAGTTHIVMLTGLSGDGSPGGTNVHFVDPAGGRRRTSSFSSFTAEYEGSAIRPGLTAHIMHY